MKPIVLAHGYLGFAHLPGVDYFQGVGNGLHQAFGVEVFSPTVSPKRTVPERAAHLEEEIHQHFHGSPVHVIAHSMGGLDARYLLLKGRYPGEIASLTTVSTPHQGTYVADLVVMARTPVALFADHKFSQVRGSLAAQLEDLLHRAAHHPLAILALGHGVKEAIQQLQPVVAGLAQDDATPLLEYLKNLLGKDLAIEDLTSDGCRKLFDPAQSVKTPCFSYPCRAVPFETLSPPLLLSWMILKAAEGDNDGMVSVNSASWPSPTEPLPADHAGVIGWGRNCLPWYEAMVQNIRANVQNP